MSCGMRILSKDGNRYRDIDVILDTGATTTLILDKIVEDLGYEKIGEEDVETIKGSSEIPYTIVRELNALGQTVKDIRVLFDDFPYTLGVDGVLGLNFLSQFRVNISFANGTIDLTEDTLDRIRPAF